MGWAVSGFRGACRASVAGGRLPLAAVHLGVSSGILLALLLVLSNPATAASGASAAEPLYLLGIPVDFILFGATLLGVALFHHHTLQVALTGLGAIVAYKLAFTGFKA